jgi:PAS domain S-box-containing protein
MIRDELRKRAEDAVRMTRRDVAALATQEEIQRLVHELQVHEIELEMQNESLRQTQREVETSHDQYQKLFDCAPVGYLMVEDPGRIARANAAAEKLLGVPRARIIGQRLTAFVEARDRLLLDEHIRGALVRAHSTCEVRLNAAGPAAGGFVHVRVDISVASAQPDGCMVVLTDISERKRSQELMEQLNQELETHVAARTAELATRNRELETEIQARAKSEAHRHKLEARLRESDRFESLGLLAAGIAHDFNNLLVSVLGNAELLLLTPGIPDAWRKSLLMIRSASRNASDLTHHLLVFAGRGELCLTEVDLALAAESSLELLRTHLPARVQLQVQISRDLPDIEADASQVKQVLMNLVTNAAEAIEGEGSIVIRAFEAPLDGAALAEFQHHRGAEPGRFVVLHVQDSGTGMDGPTVNRIFDPFFSTKFTGRGLGLASTLGIVQGHGGALSVHSAPGRGTSFEVAFRVAEYQRQRQHVPLKSTVPEDDDWTGCGPVLLIDDDDVVRHVVAQLLRRIGLDVTEANGGKAGLELFQNSAPRFPLVVLDWLMPGFSGQQVLPALRELEPNVAVILISGYSADDLPSYDERIVRLQKPMTLSQLRAAVRQTCTPQRVRARASS